MRGVFAPDEYLHFSPGISAQVVRISGLVIQKLEAVVEAADSNPILIKRKAISALFPYAVRLEQCGRGRMANVISCVARASNSGSFIWDRIGPHISMLFDKPNPPLNWVTTLASQHVPWSDELHDENTVARWASAASTVQYTEAIGQSTVDALFHIASVGSLRPHIPIPIWALLKQRRPLPSECRGRSRGSASDVVRYIRGLGDIEILKAYFFLIWSEWNDISDPGLDELEISVREDLSGTVMWRHRQDLIKQLDHLLRQLSRGPECLKRRERYAKLKGVLLEMDTETINDPDMIRMSSRLILLSANVLIRAQGLTRPSLVLCLFRIRNLASSGSYTNFRFLISPLINYFLVI